MIADSRYGEPDSSRGFQRHPEPWQEATQPCFCGFRGDGTDRCKCTPYKLEQYRNRISGPLLDRFDLHVEVPRASFADLEGSAAVTTPHVGEALQLRCRDRA